MSDEQYPHADRARGRGRPYSDKQQRERYPPGPPSDKHQRERYPPEPPSDKYQRERYPDEPPSKYFRSAKERDISSSHPHVDSQSGNANRSQHQVSHSSTQRDTREFGRKPEEPGPSRELKHDLDSPCYSPRSRHGASTSIAREDDAQKVAIQSTRPSEPSQSSNIPNSSGKADRGGMRSARSTRCDMVISKPSSLGSKKGCQGTTIALKTNYFRLLETPKWSLYQYRVDFTPDIEVTRARKGIFGSLNYTGYVFDGTLMYITKKLSDDQTVRMARNKENQEIEVNIRFIGLVSMDTDTSLQVLSIILKRSMAGLNLEMIGRNFYDPAAKIDIREYQMQLWPGYITSIRQHESDLLLNAELSYKVMCLTTLLEIFNRGMRQSRNMEDGKNAFRLAVVGKVVLTDYNNKTYRIDDVDWEQTPASTFSGKEGDTTFIQYYRTRYNLTIRDHRQPLLIVSPKAKDLRGGAQSSALRLIPELCRATGLTDEMRGNFHIMAALANHTRLMPEPRIRKLLELNRRLQTTPASMDVLKNFDMKLDRNLVELTGRILPVEKLKFGQLSIEVESDWTKLLVSHKLFSVCDLQRWNIISLQRFENDTEKFIAMLQRAARGLNFQIARPKVLYLPDDRVSSFISRIEQCANEDPQLILCILVKKSGEQYGAIKKKCCVDRAIPTQIVLQKTINNRDLLSKASKIAIQINCKLGGAPWLCDIPMSDAMVVGFDVCHDISNKVKSYGALVATLDLGAACKFFSAVDAHANGEELSNCLIVNMNKALNEYKKHSGALPKRIIIYRDGVGDGQLDFVFNHEVQLLVSKLELIYQTNNQKPKIAFIIVTKRINTRLFSGSKNVPAGTVVDDVITLPERHDFFIVSQSVRQGTATPTNYNVLYNTTGLNPDRLQRFTYTMCHMYYNWAGTTRVPAVCQYAQKLATLVAKFIQQRPSSIMDKQLYFL